MLAEWRPRFAKCYCPKAFCLVLLIAAFLAVLLLWNRTAFLEQLSFASRVVSNFSLNTNLNEFDEREIVHLESAYGLLCISWDPLMGTGNLMFQYATMVGLAAKYGLKPVIEYHQPEHYPLTTIFELGSVEQVPEGFPYRWVDVHEKCCCCYMPDEYKRLSGALVERRNFRLTGYLQSHKYFDHVKEQLTKIDFRFKFPIRAEAVRGRKSVLERSCRKFAFSTRRSRDDSRSECILVGIHIRRGNVVSRDSEEKRNVATPDYLIDAMRYFLVRFAHKEIVFYVTGIDYEWNQRHLANLTAAYIDFHGLFGRNRCNCSNCSCEFNFHKWTFKILVERESETPEGNLSFFALGCDHMIISTGTYSWWAGYLNGGLVVYYRPPENSTNIVWEDYVLEKWITVS